MSEVAKAGAGFQPRTAFVFAVIIAAILAINDLVAAYFRHSFDLLNDPDSNVRLQQVRDLIAGQSWFDVRLQRFGLEGYTPMHWTRLADIVPAGVIVLLTPLLGREMAELTAVTAVPMLYRIPLFFVCIWVVQRIVQTLPTRVIGMAALVLIIQLPLLHVHFRPGLIDHHNLQIIALAVVIGGFVGTRNFASGLVAAAGLTLGLVVGLDGVPHLAFLILAIGLLWLKDPVGEKPFLQGLGSGTLGFTLVCMPVFIPQPWTTVWCDSWTVPIGVTLLGFAFVVLLMASWLGKLEKPWQRLLSTVVVGGGVLAAIAMAFPACLNPLPLQDPLIQKYWMSGITENASLSQLMSQSGGAVFVWILPIVAVIYFCYSIWLKRFSLNQTLPLLAVTLIAVVFAAVYSRGSPMMALVTGLVLLALLSQAFGKFKSQNLLVLFALLSVVFSIGSAVRSAMIPDRTYSGISANGYLPTNTGAMFCLEPADIAVLNRLPPGLMIAPFGPSEFILRETSHRTSFAGYHRAKNDNLWTIGWLIAEPGEARAMLKQHRPRYIFTCPYDTHFPFMAESKPQSLVAHVVAGKPPEWLKPVAVLSSGGRVYEVTAAP